MSRGAADQGQRRISRPSLILRDEQCPGLLDFLDALPERTETAFYRGLIYAWYLLHKENGSLEEAMRAAIATGLTAQAGEPAVSRNIFPRGPSAYPAPAEAAPIAALRGTKTAALETRREEVFHDNNREEGDDARFDAEVLSQRDALGIF